MKKYILTALIVFCNLYALTAQENTWFKVKDVNAAYVIEFPSEPEKGEDDVATDRGTVKMNTYTLQKNGDKNLIYMTSFTKYPASFFENGLETEEEQNLVLDNSVNGAVENTKGALEYEEKIMFNGYRGRIIKIGLASGYIIKMKVILVGIKLYLVQVIYKREDDANLRAKRFFDSLELINVKQ